MADDIGIGAGGADDGGGGGDRKRPAEEDPPVLPGEDDAVSFAHGARRGRTNDWAFGPAVSPVGRCLEFDGRFPISRRKGAPVPPI